MILSNIELQKAIDNGRLVIRPEPEPRRPTEGRKCPYSTHSVDLKLGSQISVPGVGPYTIDLLQPGNLSQFIAKNAERHSIDPRNGFVLDRNQFVLGLTQEYVALPVEDPENQIEPLSCLAARIEGRAAWLDAVSWSTSRLPPFTPDLKGL